MHDCSGAEANVSRILSPRLPYCCGDRREVYDMSTLLCGGACFMHVYTPCLLPVGGIALGRCIFGFVQLKLKLLLVHQCSARNSKLHCNLSLSVMQCLTCLWLLC